MISKILGFCLIIILLPMLILIGLIIIIDDGLPILFTQKRVGRENSLFLIFKFRTMLKNTPDIPTHLLKNEKSIFTKTGSFLRKYSIDELPQLINIIKGDLVFIGPRPALHNQKDLIELRKAKNIDKLTPGLTGWAQVNGRDELSITDKVKMDYFYLKNKSISLDLKILFMTSLKVLRAENVSS